MRNFILITFTIVLLTTSLNAQCYDRDKSTVLGLLKKAFEDNGVRVTSVYYKSGQKALKNKKGYTNVISFDGKAKKGQVWYNKLCEPKLIAIKKARSNEKIYYKVLGEDQILFAKSLKI